MLAKPGDHFLGPIILLFCFHIMITIVFFFDEHLENL